MSKGAVGLGMAYRSVDEDFWRSPHLLGLDFQTKALYAYLITQAGASGFIYRKMSEHEALLDLSAEVFVKGLTTLQQRGRIEMDEANQLIWVRNQMKWQFRGYEKVGQNRDKGLKSELESLPASSILLQFLEQYKDILKKLFPLTTAYLRGLSTPRPTPRQGVDRPFDEGFTDPFPISRPDQSIPDQTKEKLKDIPAQKEKTGGAPNATTQKAEVAKLVKNLAQGMSFNPRRRTENQQALDGEIEAVRSAFRQRFGRDLKPNQAALLLFGRNGKGYHSWKSSPVLVEFIRDCQENLEDPFAWLLECAKNPQTVARYEKRAFEAAG